MSVKTAAAKLTVTLTGTLDQIINVWDGSVLVAAGEFPATAGSVLYASGCTMTWVYLTRYPTPAGRRAIFRAVTAAGYTLNGYTRDALRAW